MNSHARNLCGQKTFLEGTDRSSFGTKNCELFFFFYARFATKYPSQFQVYEFFLIISRCGYFTSIIVYIWQSIHVKSTKRKLKILPQKSIWKRCKWDYSLIHLDISIGCRDSKFPYRLRLIIQRIVNGVAAHWPTFFFLEMCTTSFAHILPEIACLSLVWSLG